MQDNLVSNTADLPLITVITPSYNYDQYLRETIESVLSQGYPNLEYIVLDDGSTDDSLEIVKEYAGHISWGSHPNMGEPATVNKAFAMARGDIIGVVNSDDVLLPGALARVAEELALRTDVVGVYGSWHMIDEGSITLREVTPRDFDRQFMYENLDCFPAVGTFFRRAILDQIQGRDPRLPYVSDLDFWLRAVLLGPFGRIDQALGAFRVHDTSITASRRGKESSAQCLALFEKISLLPNLPGTLKSRKTRRRMKSSAYMLAGRAYGQQSSLARMIVYTKAFLLDSPGYFGRNRSRWITTASAFLGPVYPPLRRAVKAILRDSGSELEQPGTRD